MTSEVLVDDGEAEGLNPGGGFFHLAEFRGWCNSEYRDANHDAGAHEEGVTHGDWDNGPLVAECDFFSDSFIGIQDF